MGTIVCYCLFKIIPVLRILCSQVREEQGQGNEFIFPISNIFLIWNFGETDLSIPV